MAGTDRWLRAIPKLGPDVEPVLCMYEPHFKVPEFFQVLKEYRPFPGHDEKYLPLLPFVDEHPDDWFLVTDTDDVIYQRPVELFDKDVYWARLSPEGLYYRNAPYWQKALTGPFECLKDSPIYNAGTYAMRGDKLAECWRRIKELSGTTSDVVDQLGLCLYLEEQGDGYCSNSDFLALYDRMGEVDIFNGQFCWASMKEPFSVVHGNGSYSRYLDAVVPK
jgi:hypothetical protein